MRFSNENLIFLFSLDKILIIIYTEIYAEKFKRGTPFMLFFRTT